MIFVIETLGFDLKSGLNLSKEPRTQTQHFHIQFELLHDLTAPTPRLKVSTFLDWMPTLLKNTDPSVVALCCPVNVLQMLDEAQKLCNGILNKPPTASLHPMTSVEDNKRRREICDVGTRSRALTNPASPLQNLRNARALHQDMQKVAC
ncbi:hypothetical protein B0H14DRAFT_2565600 [Mycena olivaceomarginata]|nr:hypothetical protein B0H14DRAFT_2565600 [Mycena olivaceomarginata]